MKKILIAVIITSIMFAIIPCHAQQPVYYDALFIRHYCMTPDNKFTNLNSLYDVLRHYFNSSGISTNEIKANPFFRYYVAEGATRAEEGLSTYSKGLIGNIAGLDVTTIADGFARFIVKRTKQELNVAFFEKFNEEISKEEYRDLQVLFPQTYRALTIIGDEIYNYEAYILTLRECFENDLSNLLTNLPGIIDNHPEFFAAFPELEATLNSGCYIALQLRDKVHPGDILADYPAEYLDELNANWKASVQTLQLISTSLRDTSASDSKYWVDTDQVKALCSDSVALRIYVGLLYQQARLQYDSIRFQTVTLVDIMNTAAEHWGSVYSDYAGYIRGFSERSNKLNLVVKNFKKTENDSLALEQYANYFSLTIDLLEYSAEAGRLVSNIAFGNKYLFLTHMKDTLSDYFDVARSASGMVLDINRRNYSAAIVNLTHIYNLTIANYFYTDHEIAEAKKILTELAGDQVIAEIKKDRNACTANIGPDKQIYKDIIYLSGKSEKIPYNREIAGKIFKYGSFMAAIVQAKSSDEVEAAIESIALPTGSSRIKRETAFNVSLNSYCGLFAGHDISNMNTLKETSYGVTAPIGIAISWGHSWIPFTHFTRRGWSSSFFISMIDIGAITAFRFTNDTLETLQKIELRDIISPGVFLSWGIPKCPLSINIGCQLAPMLSSVRADEKFVETSMLRFTLGVCVDIPVLNFYTKPKK